MDRGFGFAEDLEDAFAAMARALRDSAAAIILRMPLRCRCFEVSGAVTRNLVAVMPARFTCSHEMAASGTSEVSAVVMMARSGPAASPVLASAPSNYRRNSPEKASM